LSIKIAGKTRKKEALTERDLGAGGSKKDPMVGKESSSLRKTEQHQLSVRASWEK